MSVKVRINTIPANIIKISDVKQNKKREFYINYRACNAEGAEYDGKICLGDSVKIGSEAVVCPTSWLAMDSIQRTIKKGL